MLGKGSRKLKLSINDIISSMTYGLPPWVGLPMRTLLPGSMTHRNMLVFRLNIFAFASLLDLLPVSAKIDDAL